MFATINNKWTKRSSETNKEVEHKNYHYFTNCQIIGEIIINKVPKFSIKLIIWQFIISKKLKSMLTKSLVKIVKWNSVLFTERNVIIMSKQITFKRTSKWQQKQTKSWCRIIWKVSSLLLSQHQAQI